MEQLHDFKKYGSQGGLKSAKRMTRAARIERARKAGLASAAAKAKAKNAGK